MDTLKPGVIGAHAVKLVVPGLRRGRARALLLFMVAPLVVWITWKKHHVYRNTALVMFNRIKLIESLTRCFFMNLLYVIVNLVFGLYLLFYHNWFEIVSLHHIDRSCVFYFLWHIAFRHRMWVLFIWQRKSVQETDWKKYLMELLLFINIQLKISIWHWMLSPSNLSHVIASSRFDDFISI